MSDWTERCNCEEGFPCGLGNRRYCKDWDNRFEHEHGSPFCKPTFIIKHKCDKHEGNGSCFIFHDHNVFIEQLHDFIMANGITNLCCWHSGKCSLKEGRDLDFTGKRRDYQIKNTIRTAVLSGFFPFISYEQMWENRHWINNLSKTITSGLLSAIDTVKKTSQTAFCDEKHCLASGVCVHKSMHEFASNYLLAILKHEISVYSITAKDSREPSTWHRPGTSWRTIDGDDMEGKSCICSGGPLPGFVTCAANEYGEHPDVPLDSLNNKIYVE